MRLFGEQVPWSGYHLRRGAGEEAAEVAERGRQEAGNEGGVNVYV